MIDSANWSPWAIRPEYLESIINDPKIWKRMDEAAGSDAAAAAVRAGRSSDDKPYRVHDGVAVIPISGPLSKRMSFFTWLLGGRTFAQIAAMIDEALQDPDVEAIVLDVDSPGGTVSGTDALAEAIAAANAQKPVVAYANGCMCSAAYWIASAAGMIVAERTAMVGSIGVIMVHADYSRADDRAGVKFTVLTAGKYKAVGNDFNPLSDEDRAVLQCELDKIYGIFIDAVAAQRATDPDRVRTDMADGRVFIGDDALSAGLVDGIGNLQSAIDAARELIGRGSEGPLGLPLSTGATPPAKEQQVMTDKANKKMIAAPATVDELAAALPELAAALREQGAKAVDVQGAVQAESDRIMGLVQVHFGAEAAQKFAGIVSTGVTVDQYKAICGDSAPGQPKADSVQGKEELLAALKNSGPGNPGADNGTAAAGDKDFPALVAEYKTAHKCSLFDAQAAVIKAYPAAHEAYLKSVN